MKKMTEEKQYTREELLKFYSEDKIPFIELYKEQFKKCTLAYIDGNSLFYHHRAILRKTLDLISKSFGIKRKKVCVFAHCFNDNVDLLNGKLKTDSDDDLYFIESDKFIKIGRAVDVNRRLSTLQTDNADNLRILFVKHGSGDQELAIHRLFKYIRVNGEWFEKHKDIYDYIECIKRYENKPREVNWGIKLRTRHFNYLMDDL